MSGNISPTVKLLENCQFIHGFFFGLENIERSRIELVHPLLDVQPEHIALYIKDMFK